MAHPVIQPGITTLKANPYTIVEVGTETGTETVEVRARETEGDERSRIWEAQKAAMPIFVEYEAVAGMAILVPVVGARVTRSAGHVHRQPCGVAMPLVEKSRSARHVHFNMSIRSESVKIWKLQIEALPPAPHPGSLNLSEPLERNTPVRSLQAVRA